MTATLTPKQWLAKHGRLAKSAEPTPNEIAGALYFLKQERKAQKLSAEEDGKPKAPPELTDAAASYLIELMDFVTDVETVTETQSNFNEKLKAYIAAFSGSQSADKLNRPTDDLQDRMDAMDAEQQRANEMDPPKLAPNDFASMSTESLANDPILAAQLQSRGR